MYTVVNEKKSRANVLKDTLQTNIYTEWKDNIWPTCTHFKLQNVEHLQIKYVYFMYICSFLWHWLKPKSWFLRKFQCSCKNKHILKYMHTVFGCRSFCTSQFVALSCFKWFLAHFVVGFGISLDNTP